MKNKLLFCLAIFITGFGIKTANAVTFTWNKAGMGNWTTAADWTSVPVTAGYPGEVPTRFDDVVIGKNGATVTLSTVLPAGSINSLTLNNNAAGLMLSANLTITGTGSVTIGSNGGNSISGTGTLSCVSITTTDAFTLSTTGAVTVSGTTSISGATTTVSGTSLFQTANLQISGETFTSSAPVSITGTLTGESGTSVYTNSGTTTAGNITVAAGTFEIQNAVSVSGNISVPAGTLEIESAVTVAGTSSNISTTTLELNGSTLTTGTLTTPGPVSIVGTSVINNSGTASTMSGGITFSAANANLTFLGTGTTAITGTTSMANSTNTLTIGSPTSTSTTVNYGTGTVTLSGATSSITNNANLNFTGSTINLMTNTGGGITNSSTGTFTGSALTITCSAGTRTISNAGIFTLNGSSVVNFTGAIDKITNTGIFNAGTGGTASSPCAITLSGATTDNITNTGTFNLGSTSIITLTLGTVVNTSPGVFTLESDTFGSATIGIVGATASFSGTGSFNVQRYITGGSTAYRSYRLLSSPVNLTSTTGGASNTSINYLNINQNITNANAISGTTTNDGALTAGLGGMSGGFTIYNYYPTLYLYTESYLVNDASLVSGKYVGISSFSGTNVFYESTQLAGGISATAVPIPVGNGYLMYFIGNNASTNTATTRVPEATTLTATGLLNQQTIPVKIGAWSVNSTTLGYTAAFSEINNGIGNGLGSAGFNLVGNPYASVIDLKVVYSYNHSLSINNTYNNFYELNDVDPSQGYVSYNGQSGMSSSTSLSSEYIASGQGFIVQATTANQTITFNEGQKVYSAAGLINATTTPPIFLTAPQRPAPGLNSLNAVKTRSLIEPSGLSGLHLMLQQSSSVFRECGIYFNKSWSDNYDSNDAYDLGGGSLQMSSFTADGVRTGINALGDYTKGKRVKLYVQATTDGNYNLNLEDIANVDTTLFNIYIVDHKNQDSVDIVHNKTYAFTITNADTTSFGANRLTLNIDRKPLPPYQLISFTGQKVKDGVQLTWKTSNEGDYTGFGIQKLDDSKQYTALYNVQSNGNGTYTYIDTHPVKGGNTYRLQQINIDSLVSYSNPLDVLYHGSTANNNPLSVYPNPAREQITVNFSSTSSTPTGSYLSYIYNSEGKLVLQQTASSNTWTQDVSALKPGAYVIQVKAANGNSIGNSKFVRVQ